MAALTTIAAVIGAGAAVAGAEQARESKVDAKHARQNQQKRIEKQDRDPMRNYRIVSGLALYKTKK